MERTLLTYIVAISGLLLISLLAALQFVAVLRPRARWTIDNIYGGDPSATDAEAYYAYNQGWAWADAIFWAPFQIGGSIGMLLGERWGFLLALIGSVPFWYASISIFVWDKGLGFRKNTFTYWVVVWGIWPVFGVLEMAYCFVRLLD